MNRNKFKRKAGIFLRGMGSVIILSPNHVAPIPLPQARLSAAEERTKRLARIRKARASARAGAAERVVQIFESELKRDKAIEPATAAEAVQSVKRAASLIQAPRKIKVVYKRHNATEQVKIIGSVKFAKVAHLGEIAKRSTAASGLKPKKPV